ncbi:MAG: DUF305 domain-containing protein [Actinomycetota bacterium]|nr:DUF305 domain-containing protein [Actinomycetota bacterium]
MTAGRSPLRALLLAVIAVGLLLIGGGAAVVLGLGRGDPVPTADSVAAGFARDMSRHHLQGVEMANLALDRSTDPEVRQLAFDIAETQQNQVGRMQGWLALWGLPPTGGEVMAWLGSGGGHAGHAMTAGGPMPGMATEGELARLRSLSGTEFDVEFLRLMTRHHQGGREMAEYAAGHAPLPAVAGLAGTIAETQAAEATTMERMLTARGGTPLPAP